MTNLQSEIKRRKTFAIISHPDAGKTTITEKILYNGGVIREAGEVKGKSGKKAATSDWMALEQQRGVSITSSVMQFDHKGFRINLLDTPGHVDFGEDTYRTLMAADSAAMLIDAAKGVEKQTRKLFEVCSKRKIPIFTFANKMDREGKDPLELIDDVESTLGIKCIPITWPMGMGDRFKGLFHRVEKSIYLYKLGQEDPEVIPVTGWQDELVKKYLPEEFYDKFAEDMELLDVAVGDVDMESFLAGEVSPMTFGSAKNNWGVDIFLKMFIDLAPGPAGYMSQNKELVDPLSKNFSGFIFKIQANMDKRHRDRVAFLRVCSGRFERGMKVTHQRLNRELRLSYANQFQAQDRETVEEAFAGDIIGIVDTGNYQIGDTITDGKKLKFQDMPRFSPELFARLSIKDPLKKKQLQKGVQQLAEEGAIQIFIDPIVGDQDPIIGVIGELQFEVLLYRLNDEYKLNVKLEKMPFAVARWPRHKPGGLPLSQTERLKGSARTFIDKSGHLVALLSSEWDQGWLEKENPEVSFHTSEGL